MIFRQGHIVEVDPDGPDGHFTLRCQCGEWSAPVPVRALSGEHRALVREHYEELDQAGAAR